MTRTCTLIDRARYQLLEKYQKKISGQIKCSRPGEDDDRYILFAWPPKGFLWVCAGLQTPSIRYREGHNYVHTYIYSHLWGIPRCSVNVIRHVLDTKNVIMDGFESSVWMTQVTSTRHELHRWCLTQRYDQARDHDSRSLLSRWVKYSLWIFKFPNIDGIRSFWTTLRAKTVPHRPTALFSTAFYLWKWHLMKFVRVVTVLHI